MTANISFNEDVLVQSITDATVSVMQLTKALETMRIELTGVWGGVKPWRGPRLEAFTRAVCVLGIAWGCAL